MVHQRSVHYCHAEGCKSRVDPKKFVCFTHWKKLPKVFQDAIWVEYKPGQEVRKDPSTRYLAVQQASVAILARQDGLTNWDRFRATCDIYRTVCRSNGERDPFTVAMEIELYGQPTGML